jgi:hypothetical protein
MMKTVLHNLLDRLVAVGIAFAATELLPIILTP